MKTIIKLYYKGDNLSFSKSLFYKENNLKENNNCVLKIVDSRQLNSFFRSCNKDYFSRINDDNYDRCFNLFIDRDSLGKSLSSLPDVLK